jgi:hypothetical protein
VEHAGRRASKGGHDDQEEQEGEVGLARHCSQRVYLLLPLLIRLISFFVAWPEEPPSLSFPLRQRKDCNGGREALGS